MELTQVEVCSDQPCVGATSSNHDKERSYQHLNDCQGPQGYAFEFCQKFSRTRNFGNRHRWRSAFFKQPTSWNLSCSLRPP
eukprot:3494362-Amphidinium_carterae.1